MPILPNLARELARDFEALKRRRPTEPEFPLPCGCTATELCDEHKLKAHFPEPKR